MSARNDDVRKAYEAACDRIAVVLSDAERQAGLTMAVTLRQAEDVMSAAALTGVE